MLKNIKVFVTIFALSFIFSSNFVFADNGFEIVTSNGRSEMDRVKNVVEMIENEREEAKKEEIKKEEELKNKSSKENEQVDSVINTFSKEKAKMVNYIMSKNPAISLKEATKIYDTVLKYSTEKKVDPFLVFAIIEKESTFNKSSSYQGAYGLMQLYYTTLPSMGITREEAFDIDKNIKAGVSEIASNLKRYDNEVISLTAYNWGSGNVARGTYNTKYANSVINKKNTIKNYVA